MESAQDISFRKRHFSELSQTSSTTLSPASQRVHKFSKMDSLEDMHLDLERITELSEETKQEQQLVETDAKSARLEKKVDEILDILKTQTIKTGLDISSLQQENSTLQLHVKENEGTITRLNMKAKSLETKIDDLQIYSMKSNIVFYNIPD